MLSPARHRPWLVRSSAAILLAVCAVAAPAVAQTDEAGTIITLPNTPPARTSVKAPSAKVLVESWLDGFGHAPGTRFDDVRYEVISKRVVWTNTGRAMLHMRILPLEGDAVAYAASRCPGRTTPLEAQLFFQWSPHISGWVSHADRGIDSLDPCVKEPLWTADEMAMMVAPPPLPAPPKVTMDEVTTPSPGSADYEGISAAVRPPFEALFGKPIALRYSMLRVAAGYAWVMVGPERTPGKPISAKDWDQALGGCEQDRAEAVAQYWMRKADGQWRIEWGEVNNLCATDSIGYHGWLIGAPPQIVELEEWGEDDFLPLDDPQYFALWWIKPRP